VGRLEVDERRRVSILRGDCIEIMRTLDADSIDAIVTDPPYGISFMGREWDTYGTRAGGRQSAEDRVASSLAYAALNPGSPRYANSHGRQTTASEGAAYGRWCERWAGEAMRVLKPGGHLLAFGGSRTYHRLAAGIEDAGFEIRDQLMWIYASGFPKSHNLDGEWSGWGTALKPAHEPIVMARKPLIGTVAQNVQEHGTGALNIDGCRIPSNGEAIATHHGTGRGVAPFTGGGLTPYRKGDARYEITDGRWPANVILTDPVFDGGWDGVVGGGETTSGALKPYVRATSARIYGGGIAEKGQTVNWTSPPDSGTYSRFFLVPKAPTRERTLTDGRRSPHPTQKPEALIRHLVTLVTPPGGIVLDPFLGSGTLGVVCEDIGVRWLGIEREAEYADWARDRLADRQPEWVKAEEEMC
jgi:site-specific DNA-methyltransferase (adenine-specific)